jgi:MFS family permease
VTAPPSTLSNLVRALRHRNYRLFFAGQTTSLVGTWITRVATAWLVYRLTHSGVLLGIVSFAGQIPTFLVAPVAGVLVDRWNRHRVLVVTQALAALQSALLAVLALTGTIAVWHILVLAVFQGCINAFDVPARQSFVVEMIEDRADLANAIALNSTMVNGARLVGPSVAGVLIAAVGEGWCFTVDAVSYLAVIGSLLAMRLVPRPPAVVHRQVWTDLVEGYRYVAGFAPIRALLLLLALVSFAGVPYTVLMPLFVAAYYGGTPHTLGVLMAAAGVGAVAAALWLASRRTVLGLGRMLVVAGVTFGSSLIGFALSRTLWLAIPCLVGAGGGMMVQLAASNTLIQTLVDEDKRGRTMSFYTMAFFGMAPFGSLAAGLLSGLIGAPATVVLCGSLVLAGVGLFFTYLPKLRLQVRPVYERLGILPTTPPLAEGEPLG